MQLRQRFKNMRRPGNGKKAGSSKVQEDHIDEDVEDVIPAAKRKCTTPRQTPPPQDELEAKEKLEKALQDDNTSKRYIKKTMEATYSSRRQWMLSETPSISEILEKYPILKSQKYVSINRNTYNYV